MRDRIKNLLFASIYFFAVTACAQEPTPAFDGHKWEAPYLLPTPTSWGIERFPAPPSFAPSITYKGVEDIRFAPGWANVKSEEYWSYAFLWWLDDKPSLSETIIEKDLKAYYTGLLKVNSDSSKLAAEKPVEVITKFQKTTSPGTDIVSYTGTVYMKDYMSRQPITLNCKMYSKTCVETGKTVVFFELSPQPFTHDIWRSLDQLWKDFKCQKD